MPNQLYPVYCKFNCFREAEERCEKPLLQREYANIASTVLFDEGID